MVSSDTACVVGAYEHPTRYAPDHSVMQIHAEAAAGALKDAGLTLADIDGYFTSGAPGLGPLSIADYIGVRPRYFDTTETGGSSYVIHVAHAANAIALGKCNIALITQAGRTRSEGRTGVKLRDLPVGLAEAAFEQPYGPVTVNMYALSASRHFYQYGTTAEQLAWIKVAASHHAFHNENAVLRKKLTVDEVMMSPLLADPLRKMDCCVVSDGGGALIVARAEIAKSLRRPEVRVRGAGEALWGQHGGSFDLTTTATVHSAAQAYAEAGVKPADIKYASIYDSFTITALLQIEDLGFCEKGAGGRFVSDGKLISGVGRLPINTDGGGLCSNHPGNRGGMARTIEAVRQLRGEASPEVQVPNCDLAVVNGLGGVLSFRHGAATLILERL